MMNDKNSSPCFTWQYHRLSLSIPVVLFVVLDVVVVDVVEDEEGETAPVCTSATMEAETWFKVMPSGAICMKVYGKVPRLNRRPWPAPLLPTVCCMTGLIGAACLGIWLKTYGKTWIMFSRKLAQQRLLILTIRGNPPSGFCMGIRRSPLIIPPFGPVAIWIGPMIRAVASAPG